MKYCCYCSATLVIRIPEDDNRERYVCPDCETIHYRNPRIVAGCLPVYEDQVLLCKRSIEPRYGYWTLPGGYMELDETTLQAAKRETLEEANARVDVQMLYTIINLPHVNQVYMMYLSRLTDLDFSAGDESSEVRLFSEEQIPWDELAFMTIRQTLICYFRDRAAGRFLLHTGDIIREGKNYSYREELTVDRD